MRARLACVKEECECVEPCVDVELTEPGGGILPMVVARRCVNKADGACIVVVLLDDSESLCVKN